MHVRVNYGPEAGRVLEFPYVVGLGIVESGRGERVDPEALTTGPTVAVAVPPISTRDPQLPGTGRRRDRART